MRTTSDRIRHAISFEAIGLLLVVPFGAWIFGFSLEEFGMVGVASTLVATAWNYAYNLIFDHAMTRLSGTVHKSVLVRLVHACLFELGLLLLLAPMIALYLGVGIWHALLIDGSLAVFYVLYALAFNWLYDMIFPVLGP